MDAASVCLKSFLNWFASGPTSTPALALAGSDWSIHATLVGLTDRKGAKYLRMAAGAKLQTQGKVDHAMASSEGLWVLGWIGDIGFWGRAAGGMIIVVRASGCRILGVCKRV